MAGKLLTDAQKAYWRDYLNEYDTAKAELAVRPEDCTTAE